MNNEILEGDVVPMGRFTIDYRYMGDAVRSAVEPVLTEWEWLIPDWVQTVHVDEVRSSEFYAEMQVREDYLRLHINVSTTILEHQVDVVRVIVHELCHAFTNPVFNAALDAQKIMFPEPGPSCAMAEIWMRHALERSTENLTEVLLRREQRGRNP